MWSMYTLEKSLVEQSLHLEMEGTREDDLKLASQIELEGRCDLNLHALKQVQDFVLTQNVKIRARPVGRCTEDSGSDGCSKCSWRDAEAATEDLDSSISYGAPIYT